MNVGILTTSIILITTAILVMVVFILFVKRNEYVKTKVKPEEERKKENANQYRVKTEASNFMNELINTIKKISMLADQVDPLNIEALTAKELKLESDKLINELQDRQITLEFKLYKYSYAPVENIMTKLKIESPFLFKKNGYVKDLLEHQKTLEKYENLSDYEHFVDKKLEEEKWGI